MGSAFGKNIRVSVFGESHGAAVGAVADGFPAGEEVDMQALSAFMRRRQGGGKLTTARKEADEVRFLSGIVNGRTCGTPISLVIENSNAHSADYEALKHTPRPGHADFTAHVRWGEAADLRGGGHLSGRLTAPLCAAGGIALQILARKAIFVGAHLFRAAGIADEPFPLMPDKTLFEAVARKPLPVLSDEAGEKMDRAITDIRARGDSAGGIVECAVVGLPAGLGQPLFDGVENRVAQALFGIPAVKGVEFGSGFAGADAPGSENNDPFVYGDDGQVRTLSNHAGGILGGITTGMPLVVRAAFKPTPSIALAQRTIDGNGGETEIQIGGRHDPCVAIRAVPVVEAVCALTVLDMLCDGH